MGNSPYRDGQRSFRKGFSTNPYTNESYRAQWAAGYAAEEKAFSSAQEEAAAEDAKWRYLPASYRAMDELEKAVGSDDAEKIKALIEAMIEEAGR